MDEHQDDLEPEVEEGAELENEHYAVEPNEFEEADELEEPADGEDPDETADENPDEI